MSKTAGDERGEAVATDSTAAADSVAVCTKDPTETEALISSLALEYKMDNKRRGLALIFNQKKFRNPKLLERHGTNVDRDNLKKSLKGLNFEVKTYNDSNKAEAERRIREAAEADHSDADCFLLVFLSHGENDLVHTKDGEISIQEIMSQFKGDKCRSLVGKPKIFIIQACRGNEFDIPVTSCGVTESEMEEEVEESAVHTLPAGADFIMCYSVAKGYYSFRHGTNGSWFIQDLCEMFQKYGDALEFTELLTVVNRKVSMRSVERSVIQKAIGKKQAPCFSSMLTKKLYFRPKQKQTTKCNIRCGFFL